MTLEEVEKLFEEERCTHDQFAIAEAPFNTCGMAFTRMILTKRYREFFGGLIYMLKNGFVEWEPFEPSHKMVNRVERNSPHSDGITFLRDAFCSKECFINYIYDHQAEIIELITQ